MPIAISRVYTAPTPRLRSTVYYGYLNYLDSYQNENRWLSSYTGGGEGLQLRPTVLTQCSSGGVGCQEKVTVTHGLDDTIYTLTLNNGAWNTQSDYYQGYSGNGNKLLTAVTTYDFSNSCDPTVCNGGAKWITASTNTITLADTGQTSKTAYVYSAPWTGKPSTVQEWDYYSGAAPSNPTRETDYAYGYTVNGAALLTQTSVLDPAISSINPVSQTSYNYDESPPAPSSSGIAQHQSVTGARGNVTSIVQGIGSSGGQSKTTFAYDDAGTLLSSTDALLNATQYAYDATDTFVTQTTKPSTNGIAHISKATYDPSTGLLTSSTDENGQATTYGYDSIGRLIAVNYPDGGQTDVAYPSPTQTVKTVWQSQNSTVATTTNLDGYGRVQQVLTSDPAGDVSAETQYDNVTAQVKCVTTPHRSSASATDGSTCYTYDALHRVLVQTQPDRNQIRYAYAGNTVTVTDEDGNPKKYMNDAFSRLTTVWEPDGTGALNWETDYQYNALDEITRVDQKGGSTDPAQWRTRTFAYDSQGRMTQQTAPEAGLTTFSYDGNGNVLTTTDARNVTITRTYDSLNRLTQEQSTNLLNT
jgi:YD repeat-containing protein